MQAVEDIWTCNRCGWTYPNHHPSAKHRRNHKKVCGKIPGHTNGDHDHVHGGSSDEASSGDDNHQAVLGSTPVVTPAVGVESQSTRSFDSSVALQKYEIEAPAAAAAIEEPAAAPLDGAKAIVQQAPQAESADEGCQLEDTHKPVLGSAVPHPEEDIWICRACGWTYPNAHPSAKHRRNHKKHCPGKAGAVVHALGGSSDDDSDGEHHTPKGNTETANVAAPAPTVVEHEAEKSEPQPTPILSSTRELCFESLLPKEATPEDVSKKVETAPIVATTAPASAHGAVVEAPTASTLPAVPTVRLKGSAILHPDDDIWICKECGWTYPNHHPSAKHRRNHKKNCPGKVAAAAPAPGGSSDEDSGDEHNDQPAVQCAKPEVVQVTKEAPSAKSVSRDISVELVLKPAGVAEVQDEKKPEASVTLLQVARSPETQAAAAELKSEKADVPEETEKECPSETAADVEVVSAKEGSAPLLLVVESKEDKENEVLDGRAAAAHQVISAVHHADDDIWICKECGWTYPNHHPSAKHRRNHKKNCPGKVAAAAPVPGGSSDEDSGDEHHRQTPVKAPKPEVVNVPSEELQTVAVSRDLESLSKAPSNPEVVQQTENCNYLPQVVEVVEGQAAQGETPANTVAVSKVVSKEDIPVRVPPDVESKEISESVRAATPSAVAAKECKKQELLHASQNALPSENTNEKQSVHKSSAAPNAGSAIPHPNDDIWICKECRWTYPNHHPSAKHRRNHKKNCPGRVAPAPGGSSDEDSGEERHIRTLVQAPKPEVVTMANDVPLGVSVSREFDVGLLAKESQPAEINAYLPETPPIRLPVVKGPQEQVPAEVSTVAVASKENTSEDKPLETTATVLQTVENVAVTQEGLKKDSPAVVPKEVRREGIKVANPPALPTVLGSSVPHPEGEAWKCRHCDWTYPNAHPSAKHRRNHKKHCPGEGAAKGGSSDDDSDQERKSRVPAKESTPFAATAPTEAVASASREFQLPKAESKAEVSTTAPPAVKVEKPKVEAPAAHKVEEPKADAPAAHKVEEPKVEAPAAHKVEETKVEAPDPHKQEEPKVEAPAAHKVEAPKVEVPAAHKLEDPKVEALFVPPAQPQHEAGEVEKSPHADATPDPKAGTSSGPHQEDPNDIWICNACGWTYPNAHPSAKHRRNHKKHCPGKPAAVGHAPGGSSDDDSDDGSARRGPNSTAASEAAPAELLVVKERAMPDIGVRQPNTSTQVEIPKAEVTARAPLAQLVSDEQRREQEAKSKEELKSSAVPKAAKAVHDSNVVWICKECGWTYPNPHPSAKHRRNHKKVCKKTKSTGGGSSSDASSGDEHVGHFGKKKCFPCL